MASLGWLPPLHVLSSAPCSLTQLQRSSRYRPCFQSRSRTPRQRPRRRQWPCAAPDDDNDWGAPLQELSWEDASWASGNPSVYSEDSYDSEDDLDLFPEEMSRDPEFVVENLLALVLLGICSLAAANILLKLLFVAYALVTAGVRYTVIGIFLIVVLVQVQPGRWWF